MHWHQVTTNVISRHFGKNKKVTVDQNLAQCELLSAMTQWGFEKTEPTCKKKIEREKHKSSDPEVYSLLNKSKKLMAVVTPLVALSRRSTQLSSGL